MVWFKVDDKLHGHKKTRKATRGNAQHRRDVAAMGLWVVAGSWAADHRTDGFVPADELETWDSHPEKLAERLVESGYWYPDTHDGEPGYRFHDWEVYQPTKAQLEAESERKSVAGRLGGLASGRSKLASKLLAESQADSKQAAKQSAKQTTKQNRTPVPVPVNKAGASNQLQEVALTEPDLREIQNLTGGDIRHATKTAAFILDRAPGDVRNRLAYILEAIKRDPEPYKHRRGNPTLKQSCPEHPGEWADNCRACSIELIMGPDET